MTPPRAADSSRFRSLDGLRGVAALTVVFFHTLEVVRAQLMTYATPYALITDTPLSLVFSGKQAVWIFFILSGFVISLPVLRSANYDWVAYYPRRLIRLYLPSIASILLAVLVLVLVPRASSGFTVEPYFSQFAKMDVNLWDVGRESLLMSDVSNYNGPLWSLFFEVLFSLLLSAFVAVAILVKRGTLVAIPVALAVAFVGRAEMNTPAMYLPIFFVGVVLATRLDSIRGAIDRVNALRSRHVWWVIALLVAWALLIPDVWVPATIRAWAYWPSTGWVLWIVGAGLLVLVTMGSGLVGWVMGRRPIQWLGTISFSLYLVHVPVIAGLSMAFDKWWIVTIVAIPAALIVGVGFYFGVERHTHRLARWVGKRVESKSAPEAPIGA